MPESQAFKIRRITLLAGETRAVYPPIACKDVSIGNATGDNLRVYTTKDDDSTYLIIPDQYERPISIQRYLFEPGTIAFWLYSSPGGTVVLIWS